MEAGVVVFKTKIDNKSFEKQINQTKSRLNYLESLLKAAESHKNLFSTSKIREMEVEVEKLRNKLGDLYKKQNQNALFDISNLKSAEKGISNVIKKIGKWTLAILGVRTAFSLVRNSMSILSSYNEDLANKLESIKLTLAVALEPVVNRIVDLVYRLMGYVNYIYKAWFGIDLFARASEISMKNTSKSAKDIKKSLAGFDEMNVLSDTSSSDTTSSSFTAPEDVKIPSWIDWLATNGKTVVGIISGITGGLIALKLFGLKPLMSLGIGTIIFGLITLIQQLVDYFPKLDSSLENNGTSWEDFGGVLKGIGIIIAGIGLVSQNWILALIGLAVLLVAKVLENWNKIKGYLQDAWKYITEKWMKPLAEKFGVWGNVINGVIVAIKDFFVTNFKGVYTVIKNLLDGILLLFKGDFKGGLISIGKGIVNAIITIINNLINAVNIVLIPFRAVITRLGTLLGKNVSMDDIKIPNIKYLRKGGVINLPGKGIPVGSAMAGESGQEGVLPLTDSQQMALLGEAIGKYITINATITNNMNGRVISKELQRIQGNKEFATNGG